MASTNIQRNELHKTIWDIAELWALCKIHIIFRGWRSISARVNRQSAVVARRGRWLSACEEIGLPAPEFEQDENFRAIIRRQNVAQNVTQSKQAIRYIKIMNTLLTNRRTPLHEIAKMLSVSKRTINRDLNEIRKTYRVEWIGASKTGRWEIEKLK